MTDAFITINVILIVIQVILVIMFIMACVNIKAMRDMMQTALERDSKLQITRKDVLKAVAQGKQDELADQIKAMLVIYLYNTVTSQGTNKPYFSKEVKAQAKKKIDVSRQYLDVLDIPLPKQLSSLDDFVEFYNLKNPNPLKPQTTDPSVQHTA